MNKKTCKIIIVVLAVIAVGLYENRINFNFNHKEIINMDNDLNNETEENSDNFDLDFGENNDDDLNNKIHIDNIASFCDSFNADVKEQSIYNERFAGILNEMDGMDTIWTYESDKDCELNMICLLNTESGKLKLSLIYPDNSIKNLCEVNSSGMKDYCINTIKIKKGTNRIKIIGEKSKNANFDITIPKGHFKKIRVF